MLNEIQPIVAPGHVSDMAICGPQLEGDEECAQESDETTANCLHNVGQLPGKVITSVLRFTQPALTKTVRIPWFLST